MTTRLLLLLLAWTAQNPHSQCPTTTTTMGPQTVSRIASSSSTAAAAAAATIPAVEINGQDEEEQHGLDLRHENADRKK